MIREQSAINTFALKMAAIRITHEKSVARNARIEKLWKIVLAIVVAFFVFSPFLLAGCAPARVLFLPGECHPAELIQTEGGYIISPNPCDDARRP